MSTTPRFSRVLLKLSGEALAGAKGHGIDSTILSTMAREIASVVRSGIQVAVVIGGGNLVRGVQASAGGMNRAAGDAMGMLGTVMNCIAMQDALDKENCPSVVMTGVRMEPLAEFFDRRKAISLRQAPWCSLALGLGILFSQPIQLRLCAPLKPSAK